jgi:hypothetical protein
MGDWEELPEVGLGCPTFSNRAVKYFVLTVRAENQRRNRGSCS